jgi:hypothetical protein
VFGKGAKNYRRTAGLRFILGFALSLLAAVVLYLLESEYIFLAIGALLLGTLNAHLAAVQVYTSGKSLEKAEQIIALAEQGKEKK